MISFIKSFAILTCFPPTAYQLKIGKEVKSMHTRRSKVTFNVEGAFVRNFMK